MDSEQPTCCKSNCPMTMGYYIGGGKYICWLHAFTVPGCIEALKDRQEVALVGNQI